MSIRNKNNKQLILHPNNKGFTLIEMLVVAPIVILMIGAFISVLVGMTGEVLATRSQNALAYDVQSALDRIKQDVSSSNGFLSVPDVTIVSPQGYNDTAVSGFRNVSTAGGNGNMLIINEYATTDNPLLDTTRIIYQKNQPNACASAAIYQNPPMTYNIVYFVKNNTLWRRVLMNSNYQTVGCSVPWQQPSCSSLGSSFCVATDSKIVDGITDSSSFAINYYTSSESTIPNAISSDSGQSDQNRQTSLQTTPTVSISISANRTAAGRNISYTGSTTVNSQNYQTPAITNGLVGWWPFSGDASDLSGNGNNGTINGATLTSDSSGNSNSAYNFNGVNQSINYVSNFGIGASSVTISTWFYNPLSSNKGTFVKLGGSNGYGIGMGSGNSDTNGNNLILLYEAVRWIPTSAIITTGWHHAVITVNSNGVPSAYLDGSIIGTYPGTNPIAPTAQSYIGDSGTRLFNGKIDDVRIYNRALSNSEILQLYSNGAY